MVANQPPRVFNWRKIDNCLRLGGSRLFFTGRQSGGLLRHQRGGQSLNDSSRAIVFTDTTFFYRRMNWTLYGQIRRKYRRLTCS
jgi:hypothetical protein